MRAQQNGKPVEFRAKSVVLACGGFEANPEMRTRYLGPGWELAKVRGSRFNQGDGLKMALDIGAAPYGNWSGCHATGWDRNAPEFGDVNVGDQFQKHSYIFGLLINADGKRFVDEGWDFHSFTYAKYGGEVLQQPGQFAWQVFDAKVTNLLRSEYRIKFMTKVSANTLEELATKLEGVNPRRLPEDRARVQRRGEQGRAVRSRRSRTASAPSASSRRNRTGRRRSTRRRTTPTATTCGITFTFGGLRIDKETGQVLDVHFHPIPGLYCAAKWSAGSSTSTIRAAPGSCRARCSGASRDAAPRRSKLTRVKSFTAKDAKDAKEKQGKEIKAITIAEILYLLQLFSRRSSLLCFLCVLGVLRGSRLNCILCPLRFKIEKSCPRHYLRLI